jgi:hypothetical protein
MHVENDAHSPKQFVRKSAKYTSLRAAISWNTRSAVEYAFDTAIPPTAPVDVYKRSGHTLRSVQLDSDPTIQLSDVTDDDTAPPVADRPTHVYTETSIRMYTAIQVAVDEQVMKQALRVESRPVLDLSTLNVNN